MTSLNVSIGVPCSHLDPDRPQSTLVLTVLSPLLHERMDSTCNYTRAEISTGWLDGPGIESR